ncbi:beta-ketoacyl-ACP synthase III [Lactobacillus sp. S2-2]|uniref:beta-ketoacyl-ACP synthase III n=1 Tax=Lactobacillus sp. S2-2 TaxID=2692917 RepID=UPI001F1CF240|nr:beta-ketoacyl-ACP synthase III [Lactobacillus sp. S2-2]MCF6514656.1 beta-ketoacyl-ACP synthase III [Lactobacillus sp. S2-2]
MNNFSILASANSIPQKKVSNNDLAKIMDTSDEWISRRTGIKNRYIAIEETNTSMATDVANKLLKQAKINANEIDYIIVATMSPDYLTPSVSATVQGNLKATNAIAFDINAACSGFAYGVDLLNSLLSKKENSKGIVIGSEKLSKLIDWNDRSTAVLFGDGAAGVLAENSQGGEVLASDLNTFGEMGSSLTAGHMNGNNPFGKSDDQSNQFFQMDGHAVYNFATKNVPLSINRALEKANLELKDIKYFILHQANARIVDKVAKKLDLPADKLPINIDSYGNTAAASEPLLLSELINEGRINRGDYLVLTGFGGGLTVGTVVVRY